MDKKLYDYSKLSLKYIEKSYSIIELYGYFSINCLEIKTILNQIAVYNDPTVIRLINNPSDELCYLAIDVYYDSPYGYKHRNDEKNILENYIKKQNKNIIKKAIDKNLLELSRVEKDFLDRDLQIYLLNNHHYRKATEIHFVLLCLSDVHIDDDIKFRFIELCPKKSTILTLGEMNDNLNYHAIKCNPLLIEHIENPTQDMLQLAISCSLQCLFAVSDLNIGLDDEIKYFAMEQYWMTNGFEHISEEIYRIIMDKLKGNQSPWLRKEVHKLKIERSIS
ncbi:hypothetical protein PBI_SCTP2_114 [Salicola phage SCTP-2]|nr:hypothetical protein PBI_SCTP2_114 [Salicola phage SCTP-2]